MSELLRQALQLSGVAEEVSAVELERQKGFDVFPARTRPNATIEALRQLCREEGI